MQVEDLFTGTEVGKNETRFDDDKILKVIGQFDKYSDLYQNIRMEDINNEDSIDNLFMMSMLFTWVDSKISDEDYINKTKKMISDFRQSQNYLRQGNALEASKKVEPYLNLMIYFRNLSLRTHEKRKSFKYSDHETLSVIMLASMSKTIDSMLEENPIYENKLRGTVLRSYVEDKIRDNLKYAVLSLGKDLKRSAYASSAYLKDAVDDFDKYLVDTSKNTKHFDDVKTFNDKIRKNYTEINRYIRFDVSTYIYDEYKTFCKDKINFNNLTDKLKERAKENVCAFNTGNGLDSDKIIKDDLNIKWYDSIFIEGKPLISYIPNKYIRNEDTLNVYASKVMYDALLKPDTIIDKVIMANAGGTIVTKVQSFDSEYRITDDSYRNTYGWFRKFLDKIHLYKIPSKYDVVQARRDREKNTYTNRCEKINNYLNRKFIQSSEFKLATSGDVISTLKENDVSRMKVADIENKYETTLTNNLKSFGEMRVEFDERIAADERANLEKSLNQDLNNKNALEDLSISYDNPADISNEIFEGLDDVIDTSDKKLNK